MLPGKWLSALECFGFAAAGQSFGAGFVLLHVVVPRPLVVPPPKDTPLPEKYSTKMTTRTTTTNAKRQPFWFEPERKLVHLTMLEQILQGCSEARG